MFFLGYNFFGADKCGIPYPPIPTEENNAIELMNVKADTLTISKNTTFVPTAEISEEWNFDTVLLADFTMDTLAGNVKWKLSELSYILVKRRIKGDYKWISLYAKEILNVEDLKLSETDITCESLIYEYAIAPILNEAEGGYSYAVMWDDNRKTYTTDIDVTNEDLVVIDPTGIYHTPLTDGYCDTQDVHPNSVLELIHNRYPTIVRNTNANYETVTVTGQFIPYDDCIDWSIYDDDRRRILFQRSVKEFLTNGRTKILKNVDGQCWLCYVTTPPSDSADNYYAIRKLTFGCTETGDLKNEEHLYYAGYLNVPRKWWSSSS